VDNRSKLFPGLSKRSIPPASFDQKVYWRT
jgi:hypothetical protein